MAIQHLLHWFYPRWIVLRIIGLCYSTHGWYCRLQRLEMVRAFAERPFALIFVLRKARIFILEGIFTVVCAVVSKFIIADWPETCKFLTEDEKELLITSRWEKTQLLTICAHLLL